ncbi:BTAD domain-containing putative transcriptional regulator [Amycolatopsis suaedae]|uniref:AfsR/SARP family transcriptional regulator n=1 Tax=Amycolatopsis suaedae TaxID=2510978 RepID=A0A4Q7JA72_9PSEU|nr:BTAD domain-containing putative transcriptional regulator [Amycolatopsis suaedae]RZQ63812.1 AfsR/SARP family transcriptional regulator [Amycolatopsis suaedae]
MRFGVLGPLAVWTADGTPVGVPEPKVRALLADLVVHAGTVVSADRLAEDLWGDRQPGNPANALQTKISQLRKALGDPGLVVRTPPGYLLRVSPGAVDAHRFAELTARAAAEPGSRVALLTEALALWRGEPLADFADEPFARPVARRLAEDRLVALEDLAEARLERGEHGRLVGELADLVATYPLRERLRALHLRALYRAGRPQEALDGFHELRRRLADDLGLEPGPDLTALHQAMLARDPALDAPPPAPGGNLPAAVTDLLGRGPAVREVRGLLESARLVTLTGPGGVGKTSLALETARRIADGYPDGVWLVELAGAEQHTCPGPDGVTEAIATALDIRGPLHTAVRDKDMLLVIDNCEQVIDAVATVAGGLLAAAPRLRILATSREPLGVGGEALWAVPPLGVPGPEAATSATVRDHSAVRLFVARAAAAAPGFTLDDTNAAAVARICRALDGIPLALELAATRIRALGPDELLRRLGDRFRLLDGGRRGVPARQQTLRAMIDWSWDLLDEPQRRTLCRLAVHPEGCALDAAEAVCAGDGVDAADVAGLLTQLVDRSLVVAQPGPRFRLLESVAHYCLERLDDADAVRLRHARFHAGLAARADPLLRTGDQRRWLERLDADTANLRAALDTFAQHGMADDALRLTESLVWYWFLRGRLAEARRSLRTALDVGGGDPALRATVTAWEHAITVFADRPDGQPPPVRGRALWFLGHAAATIGDMDGARRITESALAGFAADGDRWGIAVCRIDQVSQAMATGDFAAARRYAAEGDRLFAETGDRWGQLQATFAGGTLASVAGDYAEAARLHTEGLRRAEELQLWPEVSYQLSWLGRTALLTGDLAAGREYHERAIRVAAEQGFTPARRYAETGLALGARQEGRLDEAERLLLSVLDWHRDVGFEQGGSLVLAELGFVAELRGDADAALRLQRQGHDLALRGGDPRAIALAKEGLAGAHALRGEHAVAARLLGAATRARESVGTPLPPAERGDVDRITATVRAALGDEAFAAEFSAPAEGGPVGGGCDADGGVQVRA